MFLNIENTQGHVVNLQRTDPRHFGINAINPAPRDFIEDFGQKLKSSLQNVNNIQNESQHLAQQAITNPESVNIHDVTIAAQKAELSLTFTKAVVNRIVDAYKTITNLR